MPDNSEKWVQIATRDFPKGIDEKELKAINYLKRLTGAIRGHYIASTFEGYSPIAEIIGKS